MIIERRMYSPKEIIVKNGGVLDISISAVYAGIRNGDIPTKKVGKRKLVPYWYLEMILQKPEGKI